MKLSQKMHLAAVGIGFVVGAALIVIGIVKPDARFIAFGVAAIAGTVVILVAGARAKPSGSFFAGGPAGGATLKEMPDWAVVVAIGCFVVAGVLSATVFKPDSVPSTKVTAKSK